MNHLDEAKLLSALLGVLKKENSKVRKDILEELRTELQKEIEDQSGVKYLRLDEVEDFEGTVPIQVFKGDQGKEGPRGLKGAKGDKGDTGPEGKRGRAGPQGERGKIGPAGPQGPQGLIGPQGPAGKDGIDGQDGATPDVKPIEDKLTRLFEDFKGSVSAQVTRMAYARGGGSSGSGEVRLLRLDDVDTTNLADGKFLRYNAALGKLEFVESSASLDLSNYDGHIIPGANNTYDLGSPQRQWRDLYLSGSSLFLNGVPALSQDPVTGNIVLAANTVIETANGESSLVASQPNLSLYLEVANATSMITSEINNLVDGAPAALDTLNEIAAAISDDENFAGTVISSLSTKASNTYVNDALASKADSTDLNQYLQVANSFSGAYSDLTGRPNLDQYLQVSNTLSISVDYNNVVNAPNLDVYASNTALSLKADAAALNNYLQVANASAFTTQVDLDSYLQVANTFSGSYNDLTNTPNLDIYAANSALSLKADSTDLDQYLQVANSASFATQTNLNQYLQVANSFSGAYSDLTGRPNLDVYASNTALTLKADTTDLTQYLQVANSFSGSYNDLTGKPNLDQYLQVSNTLSISVDYNNLVNTPNLDIYASNTALSLKADSTDLNQYLQVANTSAFATQVDLDAYLQVANSFSGSYNDLTNTPNLDIYAANSALSLKADSTDLNQYLQVANSFSGSYNDLTNAPSLDVYAANSFIVTQLELKANTAQLSDYLQVSNSTAFISTANTVGQGTSLVESKINNIINFRSLRAGSNISLSENNGDIVISATGELSVADSIDFGFINNDFGSIADAADSDPQYDFGTI